MSEQKKRDFVHNLIINFAAEASVDVNEMELRLEMIAMTIFLSARPPLS